MLNRTAVIEQLTKAVDLLYPRTHDIVTALHTVWQALMHDAAVAQQFQNVNIAYHDLTSWDVHTAPVQSYELLKRYTIVAVDGSQIYPDRHQGINCFLLNISRVVIPYGMPDGHVLLTAVPSLHVHAEGRTAQMHTERVNAVRAVHEFETLYQAAMDVRTGQVAADNVIALFDGPLAFWHVGNASDRGQKLFERYLVVCKQLHQENLLHAGYTSLPRATDIIRCLRQFYVFTQAQEPLSEQHCVDADLLETVLRPGQATRWFASTVSGVKEYPAYAHPYFCYLHVGPEVARVEVPAWIASHASHSTQVVQAVLSQAHKGRGYPISLAEAHEQAVVKGADRDFFYQALHRIVAGAGTRRSASQKLLRKRYL